MCPCQAAPASLACGHRARLPGWRTSFLAAVFPEPLCYSSLGVSGEALESGVLGLKSWLSYLLKSWQVSSHSD